MGSYKTAAVLLREYIRVPLQGNVDLGEKDLSGWGVLVSSFRSLALYSRLPEQTWQP